MRMRKPLRRAVGCDEETMTFHALRALSLVSQPPLPHIHRSFFTSLYCNYCFSVISVTT